MSLVPALAEQNAAHKARLARMGMPHGGNVVSFDRVGRSVPSPPPAEMPVVAQAEASDDDVIALPNFLPLRRSDLIDSGALRIGDGKFVVAFVSSKTGVSVEDILGPWKKANVVLARQICYYAMHKYTSLSLPRIAAAIGGRDHSTVISGAQKIRRLLEEGREDIRTTIEGIECALAYRRRAQ